MSDQKPIEWRMAGRLHAVKVDCAHDGWESYCGQKVTDKFHLKHPGVITAQYGVCPTCLKRTNYKVVLVPSDEPPEPKRIWHKYLSVKLRCGCCYSEQTKLRVLRQSTQQAMFEEMQQNGRRCVHHHRIEKAVMVMGCGSTEAKPS